MEENNKLKTINNNELIIVDENNLKDKVYIIRGIPVMLDFDLAEIYGYTTKAFNQQVKNNKEKFPDDFRFQLTKDEVEDFVRSQIVTSPKMKDSVRSKKLTSRELTLFKGQSGGSRYLPYAFSESGIYMLMTILKGELATKQSIALIRLFKAMKDYIINENNINNRLNLLSIKTEENTNSIKRIESNMITKNELSPFIKLFNDDFSSVVTKKN